MRIAVSMGDPNGIGPELALRTFHEGLLPDQAVIVGDLEVLKYCKEKLGFDVPLCGIKTLDDLRPGRINVLDQEIITNPEQLTVGRVSKLGGQAAYEYVVEATELALKGQVDAIVTLPVNKEATRLSQPAFSGHTGLIAELCGNPEHTMMLISDKLIVTHVTTHVSMKEAVELITRDRTVKVIELTYEALKSLRPRQRVAVAGLNPHAGENGSFGDEELTEIGPAVELCRARGIEAEGPLPPDTVFLQASRGAYDAVVAMYHDQGHIPLKMLDFEGGVNVTLGLGIVRTSVDHGTAYDIAYQGIASTRSFVKALELASVLVRKKRS